MRDTPSHQRVLRTLRTAVKTSMITQGSIERALGMSKGYLSQLFSGRIEIKVRHLEQILATIGFEPQVFFRLVYPPAGEATAATAPTALEQLAFYVGEYAPPAAPSSAALSAQVRVAVEEAVREALAARAAPQPRRARTAARRAAVAKKKKERAG